MLQCTQYVRYLIAGYNTYSQIDPGRKSWGVLHVYMNYFYGV